VEAPAEILPRRRVAGIFTCGGGSQRRQRRLVLLNVAAEVDFERKLRKRFIIIYKSSVEIKRGLPRVNLGSTWGQRGVKLGSSWGQSGINLSTWVNLGSTTWGQLGVKLG